MTRQRPVLIEEVAGWQAFVDALTAMTLREIRAVARGLRVRSQAADDLRWWKATLTVDRAVRDGARSVLAAATGHAAARAVLDAAAREGAERPDADVVAVARDARQAARALVALGPVGATADEFLRSWQEFVLATIPPARRPGAPAA